ncbi:MAG: hypothetical protein GY820_45015 [Gammaproteobacteria bacterium]|nr:hypothetical protein [Gammaproteobacteria bacterium]
MNSVENPSCVIGEGVRNWTYHIEHGEQLRAMRILTYIYRLLTLSASNSERSIRQPCRMYTQKPLLFARIFDYDPLVEPVPF